MPPPRLFRAGFPSVSPLMIRETLTLMGRLGVDTQQLTAALGLDDVTLRDSDGVTSAVVDRMWGLAVEQTGRPTLGVELGLLVDYEMLDVIGYAAKVSATLREVFQRFQRYMRVLNPVLELTLDESGNMASVGFEVRGAPHLHPHAVEAVMAALGRLGQTGSGRADLHAAAFYFTHARPTYAAALQTAFNCEVVFSAPRNAMSFDRGYLDLPVPTHDAKLCEILERQAEQMLDAAPKEDEFVAVVRRTISEATQRGGPSCKELARSLAMSERTLRRRLQQCGVTYEHISGEVRRELARRYLTTTDLDVGQVACALGFADATGLARAFKRWEGMTPMEYRRAHA